MRLTRTLRIWIAALMLGALGYAQASVSLAACSMERGTIGDVLAAEASDSCDCGPVMTESGPLYANRCLAHCTSDLQLSGAAFVLAVGAVHGPPLIVPLETQRVALPRRMVAAPAFAVPKRIQLHSFLV